MSDARARDALRSLVRQCSLLLVGADELAWLAGDGDVEAGLQWALAGEATLVVVKDGVRGAFATDGTRRVDVTARPVPVVDPVGAGDAFAAGLLATLLDGGPVPRAMEDAAVVAALAVATPGDTEGLPDAAGRDAFAGTDGRVER